MTSAAASIDILCVSCGGKQADAQTGRCLSCGKRAISPEVADEFAHPVMDRGLGHSRPSPSGAYRGNGSATAADGLQVPQPTLPKPSVGIKTGAPLPPTEPFSAPPQPPAPEPPRVVFKLPDGAVASRWLAETRAVRDKLLVQADQAEAKSKELELQAQRNRETAAAFSQLLDQVSVAAPAAELVPAEKAHAKRSRLFDACIDCGKSNLPHCANGRCQPCDDKWRRPGKAS